MIARALRALLLACLLPGAGLAQDAASDRLAEGQVARVTAEQEIFRQTPDGRRLATLLRDAPLTVVGRQGRWVEVALEGWIWSASVAPTRRDGFQLVVSSAGGENLRAEPGGEILARLLQGFLLEQVEEDDQWIRVRRVGWVPAASLEAVGGGRRTAENPSEEAVARPGELFTVGAAPLGVRAAPGGDTLAVVSPGAELSVVERREGWVRVRVEGWAPGGELVAVDPAEPLLEVDAAELRANPEAYDGRRVRWTVQFIALERAEPERTDFYEGEPFLLARAPDRAQGFVYLAVPPELLEEVRGLRALQSIDVLARVRTGRSALMGVPVLELLALH